MVTVRIRSWRPAMPSISGPRSTVASKFTVTPWVSGAICSSLIVLSSLYFQSLTAPVACFVLVLSAETSNHRHRKRRERTLIFCWLLLLHAHLIRLPRDSKQSAHPATVNCWGEEMYRFDLLQNQTGRIGGPAHP